MRANSSAEYLSMNTNIVTCLPANASAVIQYPHAFLNDLVLLVNILIYVYAILIGLTKIWW